MLRLAVTQAKDRHSFLAEKVKKIVFFLKAFTENSPKHISDIKQRPTLALCDTESPLKLLNDLPEATTDLDENLFKRTNSLVSKLKSSDNFLRSLDTYKSTQKKILKRKAEDMEPSPSIDLDALPSMSEKISEVQKKRDLLPENSLALHASGSVPFLDDLIPSRSKYFRFGEDIDQTFKAQDSILERVNSLYHLDSQDLMNLPLPGTIPLDDIFKSEKKET